MATGPESNLGVLEPVGGGDPIPLLRERLVIGRRESSDICLRFANVSSSHCELILEQGYWKVRDLQSRNGVKVNGERVIEKRIYPGDELAIAKHRFRLDYTPLTARSADSEVDELHEDIMRFSLLERAGLTKQGDRSQQTPRRPIRTDEDEALDLLSPPAVSPSPSKTAQPPNNKPSQIDQDADEIQPLSPATSAHDLSDDEFLRLVTDQLPKKDPKKS